MAGVTFTEEKAPLTLDLLTQMIMETARQSGERPAFIITDKMQWGRIHDRVQPKARSQKNGFEVVRYMDAQIIYDDAVPVGEVYLLNTHAIDSWKDQVSSKTLAWIRG